MLHYRLHHDPRSSHQRISSLVRRWKRGPVLDVGAAQGFLGQLLRDCVRDCDLEIDGIEPHEEWAEKARPFYRQVFATTVEDAPLEAATYRVVVCGDVLEHVQQPQRVLETLLRASTDDVFFIVSLPNVAHIAVRLMLLFGFFPKMERGVLDRTHLHFFTCDTARDLLESSGLRVVAAYPTGVPNDEIWRGNPKFGRFLMRAQHAALDIAPRLFAHQWVFVAQRKTARRKSV